MFAPDMGIAEDPATGVRRGGHERRDPALRRPTDGHHALFIEQASRWAAPRTFICTSTRKRAG